MVLHKRQAMEGLCTHANHNYDSDTFASQGIIVQKDSGPQRTAIVPFCLLDFSVTSDNDQDFE